MGSKVKLFFPFSLVMLIGLVLPVVVMIIAGFQGMDGGFTFSNYTTIFSQNYYRMAIFNSLWISLIACIIGLVISILGAWAITQLAERTQNILIILFNLAASFAGIPLAFSLIIVFGNAGIAKALAHTLHIGFLGDFSIYSLQGLILAYTFFEVPLGILFLYAPMKEIKKEWFEAALVLGANRSFFIKTIILPILLPNIIETFIILFANAMGTYETMYALTGNNFISIPIVIGSLIDGSLNANVPLACALATIFAAVMAILVLVGNRIINRKRK